MTRHRVTVARDPASILTEPQRVAIERTVIEAASPEDADAAMLARLGITVEEADEDIDSERIRRQEHADYERSR